MKTLKTIVKMYVVLIMSLLLSCSDNDKNENQMTPDEVVKKITWIQQACVKIEVDGKTIYFDPYMIADDDNADLILISHGHGDHLSPDDYKKVANENSEFVTFKGCELEGTHKKQTQLLPGEKYEFSENIKIEAVPAYNISKTKFHPKENNWLGFIVEINGVKVYFTGDTELIPEMKSVDCDIIMLPLGQTYTMNSVEDAVQAVIDSKAEIAIPVHFGLYEGSQEDADKFNSLLKDKVSVVMKERQVKQ